MITLKDCKIEKVWLDKNEKTAVNVIISINGKVLDLTIDNTADYVIVNHTTTITDITFSNPLNEVWKISETDEKGEIYSLKPYKSL